VKLKPGYILWLAAAGAIAGELAGLPKAWLFALSALGTIPAASLMGEATEHLASRMGPGIGGLLNVTFGNAPELIIALFALHAGLPEVVKASLAGSIISNVLLVLGASMFVGGLSSHSRNGTQSFNPVAAGAQSGMLLLAVVALVLPAAHAMLHGPGLPGVGQIVHPSDDMQTITLAVCVLLIAVYAAGMFFSLRTHHALFNPPEEISEDGWTTKRSVITLAISGVIVAGLSEVLVGSIESTASSIGMSQFFIGAVVVALVGNAAEHWVAVAVARKNQIDLSINIAIGSAAQIALLVTPVVLLASWLIGPGPVNLVFNGYELIALILSAAVASLVSMRGRSTWFEGFQLIVLYAVVLVIFLFA
jgi:Ca2+:H+ antiporter